MDRGKDIIGVRIRKFRRRLKMRQAELAEKMGFKASETISQIERGEREVKAWELTQLSRILSVNVHDLLSADTPPREPVVLWRHSPEEQKESKEAEFIKRCRQYAFLEEISGVKGSRYFPQKRVDPDTINFRTAGTLAVEIRSEFQLDDRPGEGLEEKLQNVYGVKIWYMAMEEGSAASSIGPFGPAILMNSNEAPWRRNYNFAHELFHLITWDSIPPKLIRQSAKFWENLEKIANVFASNLLLPGDALNVEFDKLLNNKKISYTDLIMIARYFRVSTVALLYRLLNLKRITKYSLEKGLNDPLFKEIDRSTMGPNWWNPPEIPERFVRIAFAAHQKGRLSRAKLSDMLDTSLIDLSNTLNEYGLSDSGGYDAEVRVA